MSHQKDLQELQDSMDTIPAMREYRHFTDIWNVPYLHANPEIVPDSPQLNECERNFIAYKKHWLNRHYAYQLKKIISRVVSDRGDNPIQNAICLGVGGYDRGAGMYQLIVFFQIIAHLAQSNPSLLDNVVVQDPLMQEDDEKTKSFAALIERHGCRVVVHPAAFDVVGPNTFIFSPYAEIEPVIEGLRGKSVADLALFIENNLKELVEACKSTTRARETASHLCRLTHVERFG